MSDAALPLEQCPYLTRTPLQYRQQMQRLVQQYPVLIDWQKLYLQHYPQVTSAMALSLRERLDNQDSQLTYGETDLEAFIQLLYALKPLKNEHFLELGCGTGALCFIATLLWPMCATGVDVLAGFIQRASQMAQSLSLSSRIQFVQQNLFQADLTAGTLIYVASTCFSALVRQQLAQRLLQAPAQSRIMSVSLPLTAPWLKELSCVPATFSWGTDKIYIYQRIS